MPDTCTVIDGKARGYGARACRGAEVDVIAYLFRGAAAESGSVHPPPNPQPPTLLLSANTNRALAELRAHGKAKRAEYAPSAPVSACAVGVMPGAAVAAPFLCPWLPARPRCALRCVYKAGHCRFCDAAPRCNTALRAATAYRVAAQHGALHHRTSLQHAHAGLPRSVWPPRPPLRRATPGRRLTLGSAHPRHDHAIALVCECSHSTPTVPQLKYSQYPQSSSAPQHPTLPHSIPAMRIVPHSTSKLPLQYAQYHSSPLSTAQNPTVPHSTPQ